jgi:hypothetical protein
MKAWLCAYRADDRFNSLYINYTNCSQLGADAAVGVTPQDQYFRKYEPAGNITLQTALLRQSFESYLSFENH